MGSKKPFLILLGVLSISIIIAVVSLQVDRAPAPPKQVEAVEPKQSSVLPTPTHDPEDFSTNRRLSREEFRVYYDAMVETASSYETVQMRTTLSLPEFIENQVVEAEVRFDAVRPEKWTKQIFASRPVNKTNPHGEWAVLPRSFSLATPDFLREIEHDVRTAFEVPLDATDEFLQPFFAKKRNDLEEQFANPFIDLLFKVPIGDRLREVVEAEEIKTSEGPKVRILMRVNAIMGQEITRGKLRGYFPVCPDCAKEVSLREDLFAADTMELKQVTYMKPDRTPFLVQRYTQAVWDEPIPEDRFDFPTPVGFRTFNIVEDQREKKVKYDLLEGDWKNADPEARAMRKLLEEADEQ